jgi:hypothetical protein
MRDRLQVQNAFDIDDSRTMDADKTNGIEPLGQLVQRGPEVAISLSICLCSDEIGKVS